MLETTIYIAGGTIVAAIVGLIVGVYVNNTWWQWAIKQHLARYHPETGFREITYSRQPKVFPVPDSAGPVNVNRASAAFRAATEAFGGDQSNKKAIGS
jgi:hypothetical protein